ncbi:uncharacterized protein LOC128903623 isoform X1 [Rissa tridactyla]|uniref:uncharacterized protein LOC128903623 isoform X1 n=1 Tax=Rissa tridactyla TaxID=75485 RepID=UPI0023BAD2C2|nr:uncharacterized protein LOC128903623 isoform X1 [Rissa tridactyla]
MPRTLSPKLLWVTLFFAVNPRHGVGSLTLRREGANEFVALGRSVARLFNLTNCWVCGGALGLESWPWTSLPVSPKWLVSGYGAVGNDTYWEEESTPSPWPVQYPAQGQYCLKRTQPGGTFLGTSVCNWTFTYANHPPPGSPYAVPTTQIDGLAAEGPRWAWVNESGHQKAFSGFWSPTNLTSRIDEPYGPELNTTCGWRNDAGAWFCRVTGRPHPRLPWQNLTVLSPLGTDNSTYFQVPSAPAGLFESGAKALKGHHWICGYRAYKALPANWTGVCYVGIIRPLFFLLSESGDPYVKPSHDLPRKKRSTEEGLPIPSSQRWEKDDWPLLRRLLETWKPNELINGAPEPIYNLNRIVQLRDGLEVSAGEMVRASDALANPAPRRRLVPDSRPAGGGDVWRTLNFDSNRCLKIDDNGRVVQEIASKIRELAHVPVQSWESRESEPFSWLPGAPGVKRSLFYALCAAAALLFALCLGLALRRFVRHVVTQRQPVAASSPDGVKYSRAADEPEFPAVKNG